MYFGQGFAGISQARQNPPRCREARLVQLFAQRRNENSPLFRSKITTPNCDSSSDSGTQVDCVT